MKGCAVPGQRGLCCWVHRDWVRARIDFPAAVGQRLQIVDVQGCVVSKNAAPQDSSLVEEISGGSWLWVAEKIRVAAQI